MQKTINRKFIHNNFKADMLITVLRLPRKSDSIYDYLDESIRKSYCLFLDSSERVTFKKSILIGYPFYEDNWNNNIESWLKLSDYKEIFYKIGINEVDTYIKLRKEECLKYGLRLGQSIINNLDSKTPTPNAEIYNERDENKVIDWFIKTHINK